MPGLFDFLQEHRRTLLGMGLAVMVARKVLPQVRPLAKSAIKGYLRARDSISQAVERGSELLPGNE
ncbi:MAG: hypothetical protein ACYCW6_29195 [Candidatus Xenobia bacterium]